MYIIPQSFDHPSACFPRMVPQLKPLLQISVSAVELIGRLMAQENIIDVLIVYERVFCFITLKSRANEDERCRNLLSLKLSCALSDSH